MQINGTDNALNKLKESGLDQTNFLRLGVQQGGCAGMSYAAFLDDNLSAQDQVIYDEQDIRIVSNREFLHLIDGLNIDFSDDLIQPGFILKNPNSQKSCGCGASFKARDEDTITPCGGNCS
jgi:iron-sulfur cluster assembly protein